MRGTYAALPNLNTATPLRRLAVRILSEHRNDPDVAEVVDQVSTLFRVSPKASKQKLTGKDLARVKIGQTYLNPKFDPLAVIAGFVLPQVFEEIAGAQGHGGSPYPNTTSY
ncbi:hypothetical protein WDZ92_34900, partial [Nostoc sp. NIES-2111]